MSAPWMQGLESRLPWSVEADVPLVGGSVDGELPWRIVESTVEVPLGDDGGIIDFASVEVLEAPTWVTPATELWAGVVPPGGEASLNGLPVTTFDVGDYVPSWELRHVPEAAVVCVVLVGATAPEASAGRVRVKLSGRRVH